MPLLLCLYSTTPAWINNGSREMSLKWIIVMWAVHNLAFNYLCRTPPQQCTGCDISEPHFAGTRASSAVSFSAHFFFGLMLLHPAHSGFACSVTGSEEAHLT